MEQRKFKRGQVWYWRDPIYGSKGANKKVHIGEGTYRYNRYVLIISEANDTYNNYLKVVPLTSKHNESLETVPVMFTANNNVKPTYGFAVVNSSFSADPNMMIDYVSTVSDDDMMKIDLMIIKNELPNMYNLISNNKTLRSILGINCTIDDIKLAKIAAIEELKVEDTHNVIIKKFITDCLVYTGDIEDKIKCNDLITAYQKWCIIENKPMEISITNFLSIFSYCVEGNIFNKVINSLVAGDIANEIVFTKMKLSNDLVIEINASNKCNDFGRIEDNNSGKWTKDKIQEFMDIYNNEGPEACEEKYGLKQSTINKYASKWKNQLSEDECEEKYTFDIDTTINYLSAISSFMIAIINNDKSTKMNKRMYEEGRTTIYYSLIKFLDISYKRGKPDIYYPSSDCYRDESLYERYKYIYNFGFIIIDVFGRDFKNNRSKFNNENDQLIAIARINSLTNRINGDSSKIIEEFYEILFSRLKKAFGISASKKIIDALRDSL